MATGPRNSVASFVGLNIWHGQIEREAGVEVSRSIFGDVEAFGQAAYGDAGYRGLVGVRWRF